MVAAGADNAILSRLFHTAIRTGRRARNETGIGAHALSVSAIAAQQARELFPAFGAARVLVVGAGEAAKLAAESLTGYGAGEITVVSRTFEHADVLARSLGGRALPFARLGDALAQADVVVAASGSAEPLFSTVAVADVAARREGAPLLLVDIALPRDFAQGVREVPGVTYFDLDDLQEVAARNNSARLAEIDGVHAIVDAETARFVAWWESLQVVPTIAALTDRAEGVRRAEVAKTLRRLKLAGAERAHVEELTDVLTRAIIRQLLHDPITSLRKRGDRDVYVEALRALFRLDESDESDQPLEDV
jgi:glutamyl-tRNA reductase